MRQPVFHPRLARLIAPRLRRVCGAGILAMALQGNAADTSAVTFAPPSTWVKPHFFEQPSLANFLDSGVDQHWLLLWNDKSMRVKTKPSSIPSGRFSRWPVWSKGSTGSWITIRVIKSLTLHWVRLWRGKEHLDRLDTNNVKIVQQEQDLDQSVLTGEKSAVLVLDDVRTGDIIDYAYSLKGANPVFDWHFSCAIPVQMEEPVDRLLTRGVAPPKDPPGKNAWMLGGTGGDYGERHD